MKTGIKTVVLALALGFGLSMHAAEVATVSVNNENMLVVSINDADEASEIRLLDQDGAVLFSENLEFHKSSNKALSFENLGTGMYYLYTENSSGLKITAVKKDGNGLTVLEGQGKMIFKPSLEQDGDLLRLSLTNPVEDAVVIEILDADGEALASIRSKELVVNKTFDFSAVASDVYVVKTRIMNEVFYQKVAIN